jgi:hypothetical protein
MRCAHYLVLVLALGCGWPTTRMVPVAQYGARAQPTVSAAPNYTAGTNYQNTYSPDGSTLFVCVDGSTRRGWNVTPGATPAC